MENVLTEEMIKDHIEKQYDILRKTCKNAHRGLITDQDLQRSFKEVFYRGFIKYAEDKGFRLSINTAGWIRFTEDYQLWKTGELPVSAGGKAWLLYAEKEVAPEDRSFFFELMEAFGVPVKYYEPLRDGAYHDDYKFGHYPGEMIIGHNIWEDDGGLLSDDFKLGSSIKLTDHYGLKSNIVVNEFVPHKECDGEVSYYEYFKGHGTIEGYTKPEGSDLELYPYEGKLSHIIFYPNEEDWNAHNSFHLWKEQIEHERQWKKIYDETVAGLIRRFMEEIS